MVLDMFNALVNYYLDQSLPNATKNIRDGRVPDILTNEPHEEGGENKYIQGIIIFADGNTLADRLVQDRVIKDVSYPQFEHVPSQQSMKNYFTAARKHDGVFFYNGTEQKIARANWVNDEPDGTPEIKARYNQIAPKRHHLVHPQFVEEQGTSLSLPDLENKIGRRTSLALILPHVYSTVDSNVQAYQIKQSAYGELGMGTVNHYTPNGLTQRFLLKHEPNTSGPFIDESRGLTGYLQTLRPVNDQVQIIEQQRVPRTLFQQ